MPLDVIRTTPARPIGKTVDVNGGGGLAADQELQPAHRCGCCRRTGKPPRGSARLSVPYSVMFSCAGMSTESLYAKNSVAFPYLGDGSVGAAVFGQFVRANAGVPVTYGALADYSWRHATDF